MRLNKYISRTGIASRRQADLWIKAGRVAVNGAPAVPGIEVLEGDVVHLDGRPLAAARRPVYIALNKPRGILCTTKREVEGNIIDFVNHPERLFPVGRLDKDSEGLILLTNDGGFVHEVLRSEEGREREYVVTVDRAATERFLAGMASGVRILGTVTKPCTVRRVDSRTFRITLTQGLNRQIRRMCAFFGYRVVRLERVRIINITLAGLGVGEWRDLTPEEVRGLVRPDCSS